MAYDANFRLCLVPFDADSAMFGVDNRCYVSISSYKDHFKGLNLKQIQEGTSISAGLTKGGMVIFIMNIEDENGVHKIEIPNYLYALVNL